jgi:RNA polymerase sigma-70 factor (ECF subfamily)
VRIVKGNRKVMPDGVLLEKYRISGEIELIGELYSRYMHLVYGVCLKYLHDREDARDAVMDIFEKLIIEFKIYVIRDIKSWLYVLTRNYCLMELRKKQTGDKRIRKWQGEQPEFMESHQELHPIDKEDMNDEAFLKQCIEKLKGEQKDCIRLFYFDNRCYREIAAALQMDEKKVKSHLQNGKRNLKICLEGRHGKE